MSQPNKQKGPLGFSKADKSEIKSVDEDKSEAQRFLLKLLGDQNQQREEIDSIKTGQQYLLEQMKKIAEVVDKQSQLLTGDKQGETNNPSNQNNVTMLKELLDSKLGEKLLDRFLPAEQQMSSLISQDLVNEKMKSAFMADLETGESIRNFISDALKKRATKQIVNESLKGLGSQHEQL